MKKVALMLLFVALLPATALGQQKTIYDVGMDLFAICEAYSDCAGPDAACTENDALGLQATVANSRADLAAIILSGTALRVRITADQARSLSERARAAGDRLAHIEFLDGLCNRAVLITHGMLWFTANLLSFIYLQFSNANHIPSILYGLYLIPVLALSFALTLGTMIFWIPCVFWWL